MSVGWPAGLFGLLALLLPIVIHLLQRGVGRQLQVASIRFFTDDERPSWRRLQMTEYGLLALRLVLFALLVALLARISLQGVARGPAAQGDRAWVVPGVDPAFAASVAPAGASLRWLDAGFAPVGDPAGRAGPSEWSLLLFLARSANSAAPIVIGPARPATLGPRRPGLASTPDWIEAPAAPGEPLSTDAPDVIVLAAGGDDALVARIRDAVAAWRRAGFSLGEVRQIDPERAATIALRDEDWVIAADDRSAGSRSPVDAVVGRDRTGRPVVTAIGGEAVHGDADPGFDARLFFALNAGVAGPPPGYHIDPAVTVPVTGASPGAWRATGPAAPGDGTATWLVLVIAALWTLERAYSGVLQGRGK